MMWDGLHSHDAAVAAGAIDRRPVDRTLKKHNGNLRIAAGGPLMEQREVI